MSSLGLAALPSESISLLLRAREMMRSDILSASPSVAQWSCCGKATECSRSLRGVGRGLCPPPSASPQTRFSSGVIRPRRIYLRKLCPQRPVQTCLKTAALIVKMK